MGEIGIVVGLLIALGGVAAVMAVAPATLLIAGFWIGVAGLVLGVPTGAIYHVALRNSLAAVGRLPARWWIQPTALHGALPDEDRFRVLAWCYAGALGFVVTVAGCALVAIAAFRGI